jgi:outer membrane translocation and assembly module TamA
VANLRRPELSQYVDKEVSSAQIRRLFATADDQIRAALEPLGYYGARVESDLQKPGADGTWKATFRVIPGNPVIVEDVRIVVPGPAGKQPEVKTALDAFLPKKGDRLDHSAYEKSKTQVEEQSKSSSGGGLSGMLARKMVKKDDKPRATIFTMNTETLEIATSVGATDLDIPAGFKLKN